MVGRVWCRALARAGEIPGVPDVSAEWYRQVVAFARGTPPWLQRLAEVGTNAIPLLLTLALVAAWWRARRRGARVMAVALLGPVVTVAGYLAAQTSKPLWRVDRPCRAVDSLVIAHCPPYGDWSFPSSHAALAGASATALVIAWRRALIVAFPPAVTEAVSRVFIGVHSPHDAAVGLLSGAAMVALLLPALSRPLTPVVRRLRAHPVLWRAVATSRAPTDSVVPHPAPAPVTERREVSP